MHTNFGFRNMVMKSHQHYFSSSRITCLAMPAQKSGFCRSHRFCKIDRQLVMKNVLCLHFILAEVRKQKVPWFTQYLFVKGNMQYIVTRWSPNNGELVNAQHREGKKAVKRRSLKGQLYGRLACA